MKDLLCSETQHTHSSHTKVRAEDKPLRTLSLSAHFFLWAQHNMTFLSDSGSTTNAATSVLTRFKTSQGPRARMLANLLQKARNST